MARSRFPKPWAITQLFFRSSALALSLTTFIIAIYVSVKFGHGGTMAGAFVASIWAILVDAPEVVGLADSSRRVPRCTEGFSVFLSFVTMLVCGIVPVAVQISVLGWPHECGDKSDAACREKERVRGEADGAEILAWLLPVVVAGLHFFFMVANCVGLCTRKRND